MLEHVQEQLELADEAQTLASEAVQQSIQRQQLGTAQPFEVFQAQEFYLKARLDYLKAVADYNKAQYSLYVAWGNNLEFIFPGSSRWMCYNRQTFIDYQKGGCGLYFS